MWERSKVRCFRALRIATELEDEPEEEDLIDEFNGFDVFLAPRVLEMLAQDA